MTKPALRKAEILWMITLAAAALWFRWEYLREFALSPLFQCPIGADVMEYDARAREILSGKFWPDVVDIHAPLYPWFLAACYRLTNLDYFWVRWTQLTLGALAVLPLLVACRRAGASRPCLWLVAIFWLFYPPLLFYEAELTSEALAVPLLALTIGALYRVDGKRPKRRAATAGLLMGLAIITHPLSLFFAAAATLALMTRRAPADQKRSRWICPLVFAVFAAAPVLPVAAYHALALNDPTPIQANSGFNFYLGNNPNATGGCYLRPGPEWEKIHAEAEKRGKTTRGKDHYFYAKAFAYIRERPLEWTATTAKKALYVWNGQELISGADPAPIREFTLIQKIGTVGFGAIAALGLAAVFTRAPSRSFRYRYRYFIVLALAYWLAQTVFVTSGRYRVAMLIGLVPPAANACWDFYVAWTRRHRRPIVRYILATIMAGMVICLPRPVVNEAAERGEAASLLGEAYQTLGRALDAVEYLKVAAEAMPNWSRHYNLLGNAFSDLGNNAEAEKYYRQALAVEPADPLTLTNLAILAKKTDRLELADRYLALAEANAKFLRGRSRSIVCYNIGLRYAEKDDRVAAERFYRQALDYFPSNREAINNLAVLALDQGHSGEAVTLFRKATRLAPDNYRAWVNLSIAELENKAPERARLALENALKIYPEFGRTEVYRQLRGRIEAAPRAPIMPNLFGPPVIGGDTERSR